MMSFTEPETQALGSIVDGLAGSDPPAGFHADQLQPAGRRRGDAGTREDRGAAGRLAAHRPRRARWVPAPGESLFRKRTACTRLGWQQAMLLLWAVISAALLTAALALNASGHKTCARSMGTACPSPSIPQHADAGRR